MSSNFSNVVDTLIEAAKQGNTRVQIMLAEHYIEGDGVPRDIDEAMKWWQMAAEQGDVTAQYNLAQCYREKNNPAEAVKWYRKSAEQGYAEAQYMLALRYDNGKFQHQAWRTFQSPYPFQDESDLENYRAKEHCPKVVRPDCGKQLHCQH